MSNENQNMIIKKNNTIVTARYSLNTNETRMFLMILYKLQESKEYTCKLDIQHQEFASMFNSYRDKSYDNIYSLLSSLRKGAIYFRVKIDEDSFMWGESGYISSFFFNEKTKTYSINVDEKVVKLIENYRDGGYTPNNLAFLFSMRNSNSPRLYDLLRLWTNTKTVINYTIDELKEYFMIDDKYSLYADFKRRVITPAVKELNSTGCMDIKIKEIKTGKKVTSIDFIVKDLDNRSLEEIKPKKEYKPKKKLNFDNFQQRDYDYNELERLLTDY